MKLGVTGTRQGGTSAQLATFAAFLANHLVDELGHGDCTGWDAECHAAVPDTCSTIIFPPVDEAHRAHCKPKGPRGIILPPLTYFARNRKIVLWADLLIAASVSDTPLNHGGTWYTIDFALKKGLPVKIIWPDGHVTEGRTP